MSNSIPQIRPATEEDCEELTHLGIESKAVWGYSESAMATFREELTVTPQQIEECIIIVMTDREAILGYYSLRPLDETSIEMEHLFINAGHLRKGHGSELFAHAVKTAKTKGYQQMIIQSDPNAAGFYHQLGVPKVKDIPSSIPGRVIPYFELPL